MPPEGYKYQEFPRVVYGPGGATKVINSEDERPDGFVNDPTLADEVDDVAQAEKEAEAAKEAAKAAEEEEKATIREYLDRHKVDYHPNLGLEKLRNLSDQLTEHLAKQSGNDNGE